jgi:hypothetical protein
MPTNPLNLEEIKGLLDVALHGGPAGRRIERVAATTELFNSLPTLIEQYERMREAARVNNDLARHEAKGRVAAQLRAARLADALEGLEQANDDLCAERSQAVYDLMERETPEQLIALDSARQAARSALTQQEETNGYRS